MGGTALPANRGGPPGVSQAEAEAHPQPCAHAFKV